MAQKKAKKKKNVKTEINEGLNASYAFMVITGYQIELPKLKKGGKINSEPLKVNKMMQSGTQTKVSFDFGGVKNNDTQELFNSARNYRSMAAAVNGAANYGWEFVSANIVNLKDRKVHYYYMRKAK